METTLQVLEKAVKTANHRYERVLRLDRHTKRLFNDSKDKDRCTSIKLHLFIYHGEDVVYGAERTITLSKSEKPDRAEARADYNVMATDALIALTSKGMENICSKLISIGVDL